MPVCRMRFFKIMYAYKWTRIKVPKMDPNEAHHCPLFQRDQQTDPVPLPAGASPPNRQVWTTDQRTHAHTQQNNTIPYPPSPSLPGCAPLRTPPAHPTPAAPSRGSTTRRRGCVVDICVCGGGDIYGERRLPIYIYVRIIHTYLCQNANALGEEADSLAVQRHGLVAPTFPIKRVPALVGLVRPLDARLFWSFVLGRE